MADQRKSVSDIIEEMRRELRDDNDPEAALFAPYMAKGKKHKKGEKNKPVKHKPGKKMKKLAAKHKTKKAGQRKGKPKKKRR